jgi:hypothetical protein
MPRRHALAGKTFAERPMSGYSVAQVHARRMDTAFTQTRHKRGATMPAKKPAKKTVKKAAKKPAKKMACKKSCKK